MEMLGKGTMVSSGWLGTLQNVLTENGFSVQRWRMSGNWGFLSLKGHKVLDSKISFLLSKNDAADATVRAKPFKQSLESQAGGPHLESWYGKALAGRLSVWGHNLYYEAQSQINKSKNKQKWNKTYMSSLHGVSYTSAFNQEDIQEK